MSVVSATFVAMLASPVSHAFADTAPSVTIDHASAVGYTTAHASGTVNPNGGPSATAWIFEYSANPEAEGWTAAGGGEFIGAEATGNSPVAVQADLQGLLPNTTYHLRLVATNGGGESASAEPNPVFTTKDVAKPALTIAAVSAVTAATAHFAGTVNPNAPGAAPGQDPAFDTTWHFECTPECQGLGGGELQADNSAHEVTADASDLLPTTAYAVTLVAGNLGGRETVGPVMFTTPAAAPTVGEESVSNVSSTDATLRAEIDPGGSPTTYRVEYGPTTPYGSSTAELNLPASATPVSVEETLTGLAPGVVYHSRFVAHNVLGAAVPGADLPFTTAQTPGPSEFGLPDNRAYELVSSMGGNGEVYSPYGVFAPEEDAATSLPMRAAADGNAVAYVGDPPSAGGDGSTGQGLGNTFLATRGQRGWAPTVITPSFNENETVNDAKNTEYQAFSSDLSLAFLNATSQPLAVSAEPQGPTDCGNVQNSGEPEPSSVPYSRTTNDGGFHALFSAVPVPGQSCGRPLYAGASADNSQILFQTEAALTGEAEEASGSGQLGGIAEFSKTCTADCNLYDSVAGRLHLINILPTGEPDPAAMFGFGGPSGARNPPGFSNVISADGTQVFWSTVEPIKNEQESIVGYRPTGLYVRQDPSSPTPSTLQLDATEGPGASGGGRFWAANREGSKAFFTDCSKLTQSSTAVSTGGCVHEEEGSHERLQVFTGNDLYEYDSHKPVGERLTDLTTDHNVGDPLGANVQGVVGTSEDGSYVYFVAGGVLAGNENGDGEHAAPQTCEQPHEPGERQQEVEENLGNLGGRGCNLYAFHEGEPTKFVATLAPGDDHLPHLPGGNKAELTADGDWQAYLGSRTAQATPNGHEVVFESRQRLTGYDNGGVTEPLEVVQRRAVEVFIYNADAGRISCASCNPTGRPPVVNVAQETGSGGGTFLPVSFAATYMPRWISDDGSRVFFDTTQALVPQDTNGLQDVYEWEREGTDASCPDKTPAASSNGCIFLLSGGASPDLSYLVDASASGGDVFLTHRGPLGLVGPRDDQTHLYDVRVGGGFPETALACTGTGCQGVPAAPPAFVTPSTLTFAGLGNFAPAPPAKPKTAAQIRAEKLAKALKACRKDKSKHKRATCEAQARKRYPVPHRPRKSTAAKKAGAKRRALK